MNLDLVGKVVNIVSCCVSFIIKCFDGKLFDNVIELEFIVEF